MLRAKISKGGKIAIPVFFRKKLNLQEGTEIFFALQEDCLLISPLHNTLKKAQFLIQQHCPPEVSLVNELFKMRCEETEKETK